MNEPASASPQLHAQAIAQLQVLEEILAAKDDNDPRLDTEFRILGDPAKALFRKRYSITPAEKRNERGTIVFLLGRNLHSPEDLQFIHEVLVEPACLSLRDCSKEDTGSVSPEDRHFESANETTLAYPQIVALKALESYLKSGSRTEELDRGVISELEAASRSAIRRVAHLAEQILGQFRRGE